MKRVKVNDEIPDITKKLNATVSQNWSFGDVLDYVCKHLCSNDTKQGITSDYTRQLREVWSKVKVAEEPEQNLNDCQYISNKMNQLPTDTMFLQQFSELLRPCVYTKGCGFLL